MGRQAIFLSDEKPQDLEGYSDYSKDGLESRPAEQSHSNASDSKASASRIKVFVKWALICTLTYLAVAFTSELLKPQSSKARQCLKKITLMVY